MHNAGIHPSSEERIWAAVAHASIILFFFGHLLCAAVWATQRTKSAYVAFHGLQALGYQVISFTVGILLALLLPLLLLPLTIGEMAALGGRAGSGSQDVFPFLSMIIIWGLFLGLLGLYVLLGFIGAALSLAGKDFKYPFLGKWLARYVNYQTAAPDEEQRTGLNEEREDRWVAAMSHATVIITMWGLMLPLLVWVIEKDRSRFLRFQSLQAFAYQMIGLLLYFGATLLYFAGILALAVGVMVSANAQDSSGGAVFLVLFVVVLLFSALIYLVVFPLYQFLGQWAALRIVQGHDYQYPVLGRWVRARLGQSSPANLEPAARGG